jgi:hypothetical protein
MDPNTGELTTVIEHDASGRILRFVKEIVPLATVKSMKAKALLRAEEMKAAALVRDTDGIIEKAKSPPALVEQKAARPVPQQRVAPRAAPVASPDDDAVVPARDTLVPARVVAAAKRKLQEKSNLADQIRKLPEAERKEFLVKARNALSKYTIEDGRHMGRVLMKDLIDRTPPGHKVVNVDKALDATMRLGLKRLQDDKRYALTEWPEFPPLFERGFWLGANEAVDEFNKLKQPAAAPQPGRRWQEAK